MKRLTIISFCAIIFLGISYVGYTHAANLLGVTAQYRTRDLDYSKQYTFLNATTTTATSTDAATTNDPGFFNIVGAKKVVMYFSRGDASGHGNTGSTLFKVQVTPDGINWYDYKTLAENIASSTYGYTVSSETISAATSTLIDTFDSRVMGFYGVRCIAVKTTDGEATCKGYAEF